MGASIPLVFKLLLFFKNHLRWFALLIVAFLILMTQALNAQINSVATGSYNWSNPAAWVGGVVPAAGQSVTIAAGCSIIVDLNTPIVANVTVNGYLETRTTSPNTLSFNGNMTVAGYLRNNGGILLTSSTLKNFTLSGTGTYYHNPTNLTNADESIFEKSYEYFSNTSNLIIKRWFDPNTPLGGPTRVQQPTASSSAWGYFGNVTMDNNDPVIWEQNNQFMDDWDFPRIRGTLTVSAGIVRMDDGTDMSDFMEFNDIIINMTGSIIFSSGPSRPFVLQTKNFTDISSSANPTVIMDNIFNITVWNAVGSVTLGHNFYGIVGSGVNPGGSLTIGISANLSISGGAVQFVSMASAPLTLNVNGTTSIGNATKVRFVDGNMGNMTINTNNLTISGCPDIVFMGGNGLVPAATGIPSINVTQDFIVNGSPSNTVLLDASYVATGFNSQKLRVNIGRHFELSSTNSNFTAARHRGALTFYVNNNFTHTAGRFIGQIDTSNAAIDSMYVGGNFLMNAPNAADYLRMNYGSGNTFFRCIGNYTIQQSSTTVGNGFVGIYGGSGNMSFVVNNIYTLGTAGTPGRFQGIYNYRNSIVTGNLTFTVSTNFNMLNAGSFFRGIDNRKTDNTGTVTFNIGSLIYSGGNFSGYYSSHTGGGAANFTMAGLLQITFISAATDTFTFIGLTSVGAAVSNLKLNVVVSGNFNITGPSGLFVSSLANGRETFSVTGEMNISGGKNSFDSYPLSNLTNAHPVILNIGSNMACNGGSTYLSANNDSLVATVGGNLSITLGELVVQGAEASPATMDIAGGFSQTGGLFYLHKNTSNSANEIIDVTVNSDNNGTGDFSHTGGTITMTNNASSPGGKFLYINSPNITYGGTGIITSSAAGIHIAILYGRAGLANFSRTSINHSIQPVNQNVLNGCTLSVNTGNLQIASNSATDYNKLKVMSGSVLDLNTNQVFSNNTLAYSGITVEGNGRIATARTQGFYDGTVNAALNSTGNLNFRLFTNSIVEYNGDNNQLITGINVGLATTPSHKYSQLDINFNGTPNTEFVYPTNLPTDGSVFVRHKLILTNGELNLDNDHNPVSGGRSIIIERDSITAITRTNGYIRSETYDSSACVVWTINSRTGPHTIPFGYNSTNYIPFTFDLGSGNADTLFVSTYHTGTNNLPFPPPVTHLRDLSGVDNSANTVDRFWYIRSTGTSNDANLTFTATASEVGSIANPRAQAWIPIAPVAWQYPWQGTQSTLSNGTYVLGANYYPNNWWTLAGLSTPLPVSMLDFTASCKGENTLLKWSTASEANNDYFAVLKSPDGLNYDQIAIVNGAGTTAQIIHYEFRDPSVNTNHAYYKLIQTDYDGKQTEYGPVVSQPCEIASDLNVTVIHTNPDELSVIIKTPDAGKFVVTLYATDGKFLYQKKAVLESGMNIVTLPVAGLATGVYFVNVQSATAVTTTKVPVGFTR